MVNRLETYFVAYYAYLLLNCTNFKTLGQFENLVFVIMSTRENIRLIARTSWEFARTAGIIHIYCSQTVGDIRILKIITLTKRMS